MFASGGTARIVAGMCVAALLVPALIVVDATGAGADFTAHSLAAPRTPKTFSEEASLSHHSSIGITSPARFFTINGVLAKLDRETQGKIDKIELASASSSQTITDTPPALTFVPQGGTEPFGLVAFKAPEGALWRKWRDVEADIAREQVLLDRCRHDLENCPPHAAQFLRLIESVKLKTGRNQFDEVNRGVNAAIRYLSDPNQHGELDRWNGPLATFAAAHGDCEDFVIAKYVALREAGTLPDDLRIVLARNRQVREDHAVLAVRQEGRWLIMDNDHSFLMEDNELTSFIPLFGIDHRGVQLFATQGLP